MSVLWPLVGKYVRIERPATPEEIAAGEPPIIGGEGMVSMIEDDLGKPTLTFDYGYCFDMTQFNVTAVWPDEKSRLSFMSRPERAAWANRVLQDILDNWDLLSRDPVFTDLARQLNDLVRASR